VVHVLEKDGLVWNLRRRHHLHLLKCLVLSVPVREPSKSQTSRFEIFLKEQDTLYIAVLLSTVYICCAVHTQTFLGLDSFQLPFMTLIRNILFLLDY